MLDKMKVIISLLLFSLAITAEGQKQVNSPYSRFNLGSLEQPAPFKSLGMGGLSLSQRDNTTIYFTNPASYSSFDTTSFIFDFGVDYTFNRLISGSKSYKSQDMDFHHLMIGFPLAKGVGISTGIMPFSNGYYNLSNIVESGDAGYDPVIGGYKATHTGSGGINNFYAGLGITFLKNLSAGVNMNIMFGEISRTNKFVFDDEFNVYHDNSIEKIQVHGMNFDLGMQYILPLQKNNFINIGFAYTPGKTIKSEYSDYVYRYTSYGTFDTVSLITGGTGSLVLPPTFKAGISFVQKNKFTAGIDYVATKWSDSKIPGSEGYAADTKKYSFGMEYTPDKFSNFSLFRRIEYRIGGHYGDNYLYINGEQIKETGVTAGLGMPLGKNFSKANFYFDFTRKTGSVANGLHNENYFTVGASINLYDWWFMKKKYN